MEIIGFLSDNVVNALNIDIPEDRNIYIGETNIIHMKNDLPDDYEKYGQHISEILEFPDYVKTNDSNGSIEYVKEFKIDNEYVKVAVRLSNGNKLFARTLYVLKTSRTNNFINSGKLFPVEKST